jgi:hypothetical protein
MVPVRRHAGRSWVLRHTRDRHTVHLSSSNTEPRDSPRPYLDPRAYETSASACKCPHGAICSFLQDISLYPSPPHLRDLRVGPHLELGLPLSLPLGDMDRVGRRLGNRVAVAAMLEVDKRVPTITTHPLQRRGMVHDTGRPPT